VLQSLKAVVLAMLIRTWKPRGGVARRPGSSRVEVGKRKGQISIAVLCAPSNRGGVKSTMWIAPGINFFRWIGPSSSA
jgi:hypothetical protein